MQRVRSFGDEEHEVGVDILIQYRAVGKHAARRVHSLAHRLAQRTHNAVPRVRSPAQVDQPGADCFYCL